jgi:hypothetical protein
VLILEPKLLQHEVVAVGVCNAEVVELADTPSDAITLAILYKLLILQLLPFVSVTSSEPPKDGQ